MGVWYRRILVLLIALGVLAGIPDAAARVATETANRSVELAMGQHTFSNLARAEALAPATLLRQMRAAGVRGLGVSETTLSGLASAGQAVVRTGAAWRADRAAAGVAPLAFPLHAHHVYVLVRSGSLAVWLGGALRASLRPGTPVHSHPLGGGTVFGLTGSLTQREAVPIGFAPGSFALARSLGLDVLPRLQDTPWGLGAQAIAALLRRVSAAGVPVHVIVFAGSGVGVLGYPHHLNLVAAWMRRHHLLLGAVESPSQRTNVAQPGIRRLDAALGQRTVRVYSVPTWLVNKYTHAYARTSLMSAVVERNLRVLYVHPLLKGQHLAAINAAFYRSVVSTLTSRGFVLGTPRPFASISVPLWARVLQTWAVVAAGLWLLTALLPELRRWGWWPLVVLGLVFAGAAAASTRLEPLLAALGAASVFGGLAVVHAAVRWRHWSQEPTRPTWPRLWLRGVGLAVTMAAITAIGAYLVATLLGSTPFLLDWSYFRGVKVTFLGTPFLAAVAFAVYVGLSADGPPVRRLWDELRWAGRQVVLYRHLLAFLVLGAIGGYYLLRSGNVASSLVPSIELRERDLLANFFTYRPLEKEFLVGYPAILLLPLCAAWRQRWGYLVLLLGAAVGQVSIIDAFVTLRTPLLNSALRETYGLLLGIGTGTLGLAAVALLLWWLVPRRNGSPGVPGSG